MNNIIAEVNTILPQLSDFINQFGSLVTTKNINVISDVEGNLSIDVPNDMPDVEITEVTKKIGILDRLITTRGQQINELFQEGLGLEQQIKKNDPGYTSQLSDQIAVFKNLNKSYKH